jgi:hypothetical protein
MRSRVDLVALVRRGCGPLAIAAAAIWMLRLTWLTWPDPIVDFGRELYVPWSLLSGRRLYADLAYLHGPLSPHLNALWFALDGTSLASLVHLNLAILAAVVVLLYAMLRDVSDRLGAAIGCVSFVVLFAFGQLTGIGNYNWVTPYSHEMTHGIALGLAAVRLSAAGAGRRPRLAAAASGLAVGLVSLTKGEIFAAAAGAAALGVALALLSRGAGAREALATAACWLAGAAAPVLAAAALLAVALPAADAWRGAAGAWLVAFRPRNLAQPFYRTIAGTDDVVASLRSMVWLAAGSAAALAPAAALARLRPRAGASRLALPAGVALASAGAFGLAAARFPWDDWLRPLPLWLALGLGAWLADFARARSDGAGAERRVLRLALLAFAALLLAKMALRARVGHYGFALAAPGTVLLAVALTRWLPRAIERRGGSGAVFAASAGALWLGVLAGHLGFAAHFAAGKTVLVGEGDDAFLADARGSVLNEALRRLAASSRPGDTLVSFVDCEMLNYLSRRHSSVPFGKFVPNELLQFGEPRMLDALRGAPPDFVAIVHSDTSEYGPRFFGLDYGLSLQRWIDENYRPLGAPIGAPPMRGERFGIALFARGSAAP